MKKKSYRTFKILTAKKGPEQSPVIITGTWKSIFAKFEQLARSTDKRKE